MGTFIWKISNLNTNGVIVESPEFYVHSFKESAWRLRLNIPSEVSKEVTIDLQNKYFNEKEDDYCHFGCEVSIMSRIPKMSSTCFRRHICIGGMHPNMCVTLNGYPSWFVIFLAKKEGYLLNGVLTIQCKLWNVNEDNLEACPSKAPPLVPMFYHAITKLGVRTFSTDWLLSFSDLKEGNIQTKQFIWGGRNQPVLDVETSTEKPNKLGFVFKLSSFIIYDIVITCRISVLDISEHVKMWKECSLRLKSKVNSPQFISIDTLSTNKSEYVKNNQIKLVFDFTFRTDEYSVIESISKFPPQIEPDVKSLETRHLFTTKKNTVCVDATTSTDMETDLPIKVLKENLLDMYVSSSWSDVVLEAEDQSFPCHRCILCIRSPVFSTILSESTTHKTNLKASTLGSMLRFMYTGDIGVLMDFQSALELFEAATKYQVISLKDISSRYLENNMTEQNVCEVLILAYQCEDMELKKRIDNFILNCSKKDSFIKSSKWEDLVKNNPKPIVDIMFKLLVLGVMEDEELAIFNVVNDINRDPYDSADSAMDHGYHFYSIFESSLFSDFKLCTNGKTFAVHKNILFARSPVFKAMFSSNIKESSLDIPDMDEQTMEHLLSFMYSGTIEMPASWQFINRLEELIKLYYSANKYQILSLKDWCCKSFVDALTIRNACEALRLADQHKDLKLKNEVLDYFVKNDEEIFLTHDSGWEKFMQTDITLSNEAAFRVMAKKMKKLNIILEPEDQLILSQSDPDDILQADLLSLYEEKFLPDCTLHVNEKSFEVHKNILCARSPVFNAMFTGNLEEATTNVLEISDIDETTVDLMLRYLYTGTFSDNGAVDLFGLYYAADKYQIDSLKDWCSDLLGERIGVSNVCETLSFAFRHEDKRLETLAREYVVDFYEEVFPSDLWKDFIQTEPDVACRTMYYVYTTCVMYLIK